MSIDETLKENLIADVENILDIRLTPNEDAALARCFEITIGHHFKLQPVTDKEATTEQEKPQTAEEILEDELNEVGYSFKDQLKPDDIPIKIVKKVNKAIIRAMKRYANQKHIPTDCYLKEFVRWFYTEYRQELTLQTNDDPLIYGFNNQYKKSGTLDELFTYWKEQIK